MGQIVAQLGRRHLRSQFSQGRNNHKGRVRRRERWIVDILDTLRSHRPKKIHDEHFHSFVGNPARIHGRHAGVQQLRRHIRSVLLHLRVRKIGG